MLLADGGAVFAPVTSMVGGIAAMALANHERLKQRIEVLEKRLAQAEWRGQPRRLNSGLGEPPVSASGVSWSALPSATTGAANISTATHARGTQPSAASFGCGTCRRTSLAGLSSRNP
jgi:hypothetical protein